MTGESGEVANAPELEVPETELAKTTDETLTPEEKNVLNKRSGLAFDLDLKETAEVQQYFTYFTHTKRKTFEAWLKRAEPYLPIVRKVFDEYGLPQDLVLLPFVESGYNVKGYSPAHAAGMWQFIPGTGRKYGLSVDWWVDERRDPYLATEAAARYLKELYGMFGDWYLALAAYNAGEGKIKRALEITNAQDFFELSRKNGSIQSYRRRLRTETKHYVPKFIAISKIYQNLDTLGFDPVRWDKEPNLTHAQVAGGTDLLALSRACGVSWTEFYSMNPAFNRQVSPPHKSCTVHLPVDRQSQLMAFLSSPSSRPYAGYHEYKVRRGDCWSIIATRTGIPVEVLKKVNNTKSNNLKPGQVVMVPGNAASARALASVAPASSSIARSDKRSNAARCAVAGKYTVRSGDTLWSIARRHGVSVSELKKANDLGGSSVLKAGRKLSIPGYAPVAEASSAKSKSASKQQAAKAESKTVAKAESKKAESTTAKADPKAEKTRQIAQARSNYTVKNGDTMWSISRRFDTTVANLLKANGMSDAGALRAGQKLYIPDGSGKASIAARKEADKANAKLVQYQVKNGDTLWSISRKLGVTTADLKKWNNLSSRSLIHPGDNLKVYVE